MSQGSGFAQLLTPRGTAAVPRLSLYDRQRVGRDVLIFADVFNSPGGASRRPHGFRWTGDNTVPSITITGYGLGAMTLNSSQDTAAGTYAAQTLRAFRTDGGSGLCLRVQAKHSTAAHSSYIREMGFGVPSSGSTAPYNGAVFRWGSDATFKCVLVRDGTETLSSALTAPSVDTLHLYEIYLYDDRAVFLIDGAVQFDQGVPSGDVSLLATYKTVHIFAKINATTTTPTPGPALAISAVHLYELDSTRVEPWSHIKARQGDGAQYESDDQGQACNWTNSAAPAAATLSNTSAGYATLGGQFLFNAVAGAETDYALFAFKVAEGQQLVITDVRISTYVSTALGTNGQILQWGLAVNGTAVSLATADATAFNGVARAPRRIPLGVQAYQASAAVGTQASDLDVHFQTPVVVEAAGVNKGSTWDRYVHVFLKIPTGSATGAIRGTVMVHGYYD